MLVGLLLVAAGLGLVGWTGWQLWGTDIVRQREHERVVTQLEQQWGARAARQRRPGRAPGDPRRAAAGHALAAGRDEIVVTTQEATCTDALTTGGDDLTVPFTESWMLHERPVDPDPGEVTPALSGEPHLLTLTTCAELFRTEDRSIAFATLVSTEPR